MGVIDSLSAGFRLILRRWWLMLIPVLLDLLLWMGPRISVGKAMLTLKSVLVVPSGMQLSQEYQAALAQATQLLEEIAQSSNLLTLLSTGIPGIPTLLSSATPEQPLWAGVRQVMELASLGDSVLAALALFVVGALVASIYVTAIGRFVLIERGDELRLALLRQVPKNWLAMLGFLLLLLGLLLLVGIPLVLIAGFAMVLSQAVGLVLLNLMTIVLLWLGIWVAVYLYFVIHALVINRAGLLRAMWNSLNVVARNFWSTVGLILLVNVISTGMFQIWQRLLFAPWTTVLAMLANAFIGTGLVAGTLFFYHGRHARWQENPGSLNLAVFRQKQ